MSKTKDNSNYVLFIASSSVILNIVLCMKLFGSRGGDKSDGLTWSRKAKEEAELASSMDCSGQREAHLPMQSVLQWARLLSFLSRLSCRCKREHAARSAILISGWHRLSYSYTFGDRHEYISYELEKLIRKLHEVVGNAVTDGRYIVFGVGATQLLNAAVQALSPDNPSFPARVVASAPYYKAYRTQTEYFESKRFKFEGEASIWVNSSDTTRDIIEFVTSPNNPNGQLKRQVLTGPNVKTIHDRAYYWPNFTPIVGPANEELSIFSISKLTGHAGSRFG
ncbi:hypothetical protein CDL15_Pgr016054 [Punica granatum]|uniref:Alliinase C-terminal domain-containing protein n=1 Tax=Punica granatum TaxID=22663 RepID=A0A218XPV5_PUNGR|nr:hypothetical protein CDL15_Pgr016054 [Punica granatum]PKI35460.1 hypothetical protein CRG98_044146 [Punica granatum]